MKPLDAALSLARSNGQPPAAAASNGSCGRSRSPAFSSLAARPSWRPPPSSRLGLDPRPGAAALAAYGRDPGDPALDAFIEARALQVAVWTAFMAERQPELRERARQRLARWPA